MAISTIEIAPLDADDPAQVDAVYRVSEDAIHAECPTFAPECRYSFGMQLVLPRPGNERHLFVARSGEEIVGGVCVDLPTDDNTDKVHIDVRVDPAHRRHGIGRALYAHAASFGRSRGRTSALAFSPATDALNGFAAAVGLRNGLTDARRRLLVADLDHAELDRLYAEGVAKAAGYRAVTWIGTPPEELLADLAELDGTFMTEAPLGELEYEAQHSSVDKLREQHEVFKRYGSKRYQTAMVHEASGRVVAWSALRVTRSNPEHAWQLITLVAPDHRGRRLGIVSKVVNLRLLLANEPRLAVIDTYNAAENSYMIAINEAMGFRLLDLWHNWQGPTA